jgi:transposase
MGLHRAPPEWGRPPISKEIIEILLRMAREKAAWCYDRIQGALANLGHRISDSTVAKILKEHGNSHETTRQHAGPLNRVQRLSLVLSQLLKDIK